MDDVFKIIKARVSLRSIMERDGAEFRRTGRALTTCCPIHKENTPSCHLHETEDGDWYVCFGCGSRGDIFTYMRDAHGMETGQAVEALKPLASLDDTEIKWIRKKREVAKEIIEPIVALSPEDDMKWRKACANLLFEHGEIENIATQRGFSPALIAWAAQRELMGRVLYNGTWREAFLIERPTEGGGVERIGWHVRLAPKTPGNDSEKASWRYRPRKGLGAWPFLILPQGGISTAQYYFILEGQWDALAIVDLFSWYREWPKEVAVIGVRGSTSWERLFRHTLNPEAVAFLIGDSDSAGESWFLPRKDRPEDLTFSEALAKMVRKVWAFRPNPNRGKDLNDIIRVASEAGKELLRASIRKLIKRKEPPKAKKKTFYSWLRLKQNKSRAVNLWSYVESHKAKAPKGRARKCVWVRFTNAATPDVRDEWIKLYREWEQL